MTGLEKMSYAKEIVDLLKTVVVSGECIKNTDGREQLSKREVRSKIRNIL